MTSNDTEVDNGGDDGALEDCTPKKEIPPPATEEENAMKSADPEDDEKTSEEEDDDDDDEKDEEPPEREDSTSEEAAAAEAAAEEEARLLQEKQQKQKERDDEILASFEEFQKATAVPASVSSLEKFRKLLHSRIIETDHDKSPLPLSEAVTDDEIGEAIVQALEKDTSNTSLLEQGGRVLGYLAQLEGPQRFFPERGALFFERVLQDHSKSKTTSVLEAILMALAGGLQERGAKHLTPEEAGSIVTTVACIMKENLKQEPIVSYALSVYGSLAFKQKKTQDELTESIKTIVKALKEHKQMESKRNACSALASLSLNHPNNQDHICQLGLSTLLDAMRLYVHDADYQVFSIRVLANLCQHPTAKQTLLTKGGLDCILTAMKDYTMHVSMQSTGCRALANLFAGTSDEIKAKGTPCIKTALRAMRSHPYQSAIQFYGCCALRNLSRIQGEAVAQAGGLGTMVVAMREHLPDERLQEQACGALFNMLAVGVADDLLTLAHEGGIDVLLQVLRYHAKNPAVQQQGLATLACLSHQKGNHQEAIVISKGIDLTLGALNEHGISHVAIAKHGCAVLENLTITSDFQTAVLAKGGMRVLMGIFREHQKVAIVQHYGISTLRNLCLNKLNCGLVGERGGIIAFLGAMRLHPKHTVIQAIGCDGLGLLADVPENQLVIQSKKGVITVLNAMKRHPQQLIVQDRGIGCLHNMSRDREAVHWMRQNGAILVIRVAFNQLPRASENKAKGIELAKRIHQNKVLMTNALLGR